LQRVALGVHVVATAHVGVLPEQPWPHACVSDQVPATQVSIRFPAQRCAPASHPVCASTAAASIEASAALAPSGEVVASRTEPSPSLGLPSFALAPSSTAPSSLPPPSDFAASPVAPSFAAFDPSPLDDASCCVPAS
jgi:hypothetical protein